MLRKRRIFAQIIEGVVAGPALCMDARIDHEPRRPPDLIVEHPEAIVGRFVHAHFLAQPFAIKRPALAVSGQIGVLAKRRLMLVLERERNLKGVSRRGFVQRECGQIVQRAARKIIGIQQKESRAAAACRIERRQIVGNRLDGEARPRQKAEVLRRLAVELLGDPRSAHRGRSCAE